MGEFYCGMGKERGKKIPKEDALNYAMEQCGVILTRPSENAPCRSEFEEMLEEWFFSGSWIKVNDERIKNL